jgi:hypothetical protein
VTIPGKDEERENRLAGLGPLAGILTGTVAAAAYARPALARVPAPLAAALLGALAMAGSDGPLVGLGLTSLTSPSDWSPADWAGDVIPHLGYGAVVNATLAAFEND